MSIYVDPAQTFRIILKFRQVRNIDGDVVGIKLLSENAEGDDVQSCICEAVGRDFDNMSSVLEACSAINHTTGRPMIIISKFCKMIILRFFKSWNNYADDDATDPIPITSDTIGGVHYKIIRALARRWLLYTDGNIEAV